jgi:ribonuclease III
MDHLQTFSINIPDLEDLIGYSFHNKRLLVQACVHRSFCNEHRDLFPQHNERLEFLGDSVLGLVISEHLYTKLPQEEEGYLSQLRSQIVDAATCAQLSEKIGVDRFVLLGKGERLNGGRGRDTIKADLFEALVGAIYLDGGFEKAREFIYRHCLAEMERVVRFPIRNWKAELQDYSQRKHQKPPLYKVLKALGPDHSKSFHVAVYVEDLEVGVGLGFSKKEAEVKAAQDALRKLNV